MLPRSRKDSFSEEKTTIDCEDKGIEKLPSILLIKIAEFLSVKERIPMSFSSPILRKSNKKVPVDFRSYSLIYKTLLEFLKFNPDAKVIGASLKVEPIDKYLSGLEPCLEHFKYLTIRENFGTQLRDFSFLLKCKKLEFFNTNIPGNVLPYLTNSPKLVSLVFVGSKEEKYNPILENLKSLIACHGSRSTLSIKGCPSLTKLNIIESSFTSVRLKSNNNIDRINIYRSPDLDLSFVFKCIKLNSLTIMGNQDSLDLEILSNCKSLSTLRLSLFGNLIGDFSGFKLLKCLELTDINNMGDGGKSVLPKIPPSLTYLKISLPRFEGGEPFDMKSLLICTRLERLYIKKLGDTISLNDISNCKSLKYIKIHVHKINDLAKLEPSSSLISLTLESNDHSADIKLSEFPLLKNMTLAIAYLERADCLEDCKNLESLDIYSTEEVFLGAIKTCPSLEIIILDTLKVKDHSSFTDLPKLKELHISDNQIPFQGIRMLKDKIVPWSEHDIKRLRDKNDLLFGVLKK